MEFANFQSEQVFVPNVETEYASSGKIVVIAQVTATVLLLRALGKEKVIPSFQGICVAQD
jgi:hypothetical protein